MMKQKNLRHQKVIWNLGMSEKTKSHGRLAIRPSLKPRALMTDTPELENAWTVKVITLFPEAFPGVLDRSLTGKALQEGLWQLQTIELRGFGLGKHKDVDHPPAGGGAGMVLKADVVGPALEDARRGTPMDPKQWPVIYMSPRGKQLTQSMVQSWSEAKGMTILCGRFEGVDERVLEEFNVEEISLGDFVLTGGEVTASKDIKNCCFTHSLISTHSCESHQVTGRQHCIMKLSQPYHRKTVSEILSVDLMVVSALGSNHASPFCTCDTDAKI